MVQQVTRTKQLLKLKVKTQIRRAFGYLNVQQVQPWNFPEPAAGSGKQHHPYPSDPRHWAVPDGSRDISTSTRGLQRASSGTESWTQPWPVSGVTSCRLRAEQNLPLPFCCQTAPNIGQTTRVAVLLLRLKLELEAPSFFSFSHETGHQTKTRGKRYQTK